VSEDEAGPAADLLSALGLAVQPTGGGSLSVSGAISDGSQISCVLAAEGIYVSALAQDRPDLERIFLSLTEGGGGAGAG
jgi:ABC-2 type transport system ATP-binding protein